MRRWGGEEEEEEEEEDLFVFNDTIEEQEPGAGVMRKLEGRAEALEGTLNSQNAGILLWAACVSCSLRAPGQASRWVHTLAQPLASLGNAVCMNTPELCQTHQFFVFCSVEPNFSVEAINDMGYSKDACYQWRTRFAVPSRDIPSS